MLGLNGQRIMSTGQLTYFVELRENMRKDAGLLSDDEIMLSKMLEFINKNFKGNKYLHKTILSKLHFFTNKKHQDIADLPMVNEIITKNSFEFPADMNENAQRSFFTLMLKNEPNYFWKLSLIIFNILI